MPVLSTIAVTTGEPAGIGPEIALRAAWALRGKVRAVLIGDVRLLSEMATRVDSDIRLQAIKLDDLRGGKTLDADILPVVDSPLVRPAKPGQPDASNSRAVLHMLDMAIDGAQDKLFDAIVTAPLQKSIINDAGVPFTGHTEYLADKTHTAQVVMMLAGSVSTKEASFPLRVALATTHLPLKNVASAITTDGLLETLSIIDRDLKKWFGMASPRILVCGLNPHAGEDGYLGTEEIEVIAPAITAAKQKNINVTGPYPADTLFQPNLLQQADCVLAMFHDQGLPVLKHASFGSAVNVTLGLPIIRTSVDHGTALDQAQKGVGHANHRSMIEAILLAAQMAAQEAKAMHGSPQAHT